MARPRIELPLVKMDSLHTQGESPLANREPVTPFDTLMAKYHHNLPSDANDETIIANIQTDYPGLLPELKDTDIQSYRRWLKDPNHSAPMVRDVFNLRLSLESGELPSCKTDLEFVVASLLVHTPPDTSLGEIRDILGGDRTFVGLNRVVDLMVLDLYSIIPDTVRHLYQQSFERSAPTVEKILQSSAPEPEKNADFSRSIADQWLRIYTHGGQDRFSPLSLDYCQEALKSFAEHDPNHPDPRSRANHSLKRYSRDLGSTCVNSVIGGTLSGVPVPTLINNGVNYLLQHTRNPAIDNRRQ